MRTKTTFAAALAIAPLWVLPARTDAPVEEWDLKRAGIPAAILKDTIGVLSLHTDIREVICASLHKNVEPGLVCGDPV